MKNGSNKVLIAIIIILVIALVGLGGAFVINSFNDQIDDLKDEIRDLEKEKEESSKKNDEDEDKVDAEEDNNAKEDEDSNDTGYSTDEFKTIKPSDIKRLSKGKTIVVWIGFQACGYSQAYAPLLSQVATEYGIRANYIDLTAVTDDEISTIMALTGKGEWAEFASSFMGTPFTMIINDNKVIGGIDGYREAKEIDAAFKEAGLKKN